VLDEQAPTEGAVIEHRLGKAALSPVCRLIVPVATGGTFSAWIRVLDGFQCVYSSCCSHIVQDPGGHPGKDRFKSPRSICDNITLLTCHEALGIHQNRSGNSRGWVMDLPTPEWLRYRIDRNREFGLELAGRCRCKSLLLGGRP
jgi:hypothetical protein